MLSVGALFIDYSSMFVQRNQYHSSLILSSIPSYIRLGPVNAEFKKACVISYWRGRGRLKGIAGIRAPSFWLTELSTSVWQGRHLMDILLTDYIVKLLPYEERN